MKYYVIWNRGSDQVHAVEVGWLSYNRGSPDSRDTGGSFGEEGRTPERQRALGVLEETSRATGKSKNQTARPHSNPAAWELQK